MKDALLGNHPSFVFDNKNVGDEMQEQEVY